MSPGDQSTSPADPGGNAQLGEQFKNAEAEAKPYVGTEDSDDGDSRADDAVAAGADPDGQDARRGAGDLDDAGLPPVAPAPGLDRD